MLETSRRGFLKLLGIGTASAAVVATGAAAPLAEEPVLSNRVWFFPKEIKLYNMADLDETLGSIIHLRYDVTPYEIDAAMRGEIPWDCLKSGTERDRQPVVDRLKEYRNRAVVFQGPSRHDRKHIEIAYS